jgi:hypothetical protein
MSVDNNNNEINLKITTPLGTTYSKTMDFNNHATRHIIKISL